MRRNQVGRRASFLLTSFKYTIMNGWKDKYSAALPLVGLGSPLVGMSLTVMGPPTLAASPLAWFMLFAWAVVSELSTKGLKRVMVSLFPGVQAFKRPSGAKDCDAFASNGDVSGKPGFPSGHMSMAALYAAIFLTSPLLRVFSKDIAPFERGKEGGGRTHREYIALVIALVIALALVLVTAYVRLSQKCHNYVQVIGGTVWGGLLGAAFVFAMKDLQKKKEEGP